MSTCVSFDTYAPDHLSYSTVSGYRDCPARFRFQKVMGLEQRPGWAAIGGNAVHEATEVLDYVSLGALAGEYDWAPADADPVDLFNVCFDRAIADRRKHSPSFNTEDYVATGRASVNYGGKRGQSWWRDNGPGMVRAWLDWREATGWEIAVIAGTPMIETRVDFDLGDGIVVTGFIDRGFVLPSGQLAILDLKTGRIPETGEQLGLYATAFEVIHGSGFRPSWGYYWTPDKGHGQPVGLDMYSPEYFKRLYTQVALGINAGSFPPHPMNNCKAWCSVSRYCGAVGGPEAREVDPLFISASSDN